MEESIPQAMLRNRQENEGVLLAKIKHAQKIGSAAEADHWRKALWHMREAWKICEKMIDSEDSR